VHIQKRINLVQEEEKQAAEVVDPELEAEFPTNAALAAVVDGSLPEDKIKNILNQV
jgi:hypothetical protein